MGNKNYIVNGGIIKLVDFVSVTSKGKKVISPKNSYLLNLGIKALDLKTIGCNFVIDTVYKNDTERLNNNTSVRSSKYDKINNNISLKDIVNLFNLINVLLDDRQLLCRINDKENLIVQVVRSEAKLTQYFKREKDSEVITVVKTYDLVTDTITESEEKTRKGLAKWTDDDTKKALENFKKCDGVLTDKNSNKIDFSSHIKPLENKTEKTEKNSKSA